MQKLSEKEFREYSLSGNLYRLIVQVGTPLAIFAVFNSLFSILDTMMASHLGTIDVSTVAYMGQLRMILNALGSGLVTGSMILINRAYGAGDNEKANMLMNTLIRVILIMSAIFIAMLPFVPLILRLIRTPEEFIQEGTPYFRVIVIATTINFINLIYINVEKSRGNTKVIMIQHHYDGHKACSYSAIHLCSGKRHCLYSIGNAHNVRAVCPVFPAASL